MKNCRSSWTVMSEVSTISSAISRIGVMPARSSRMPSLTDRSRRQRMRPPGLAEAPDQRRVAGLEEDQHRIQAAHLAQLLEDLRERRQEVAFAHVDDDRDLVDVAAAHRQLGQRRDQRRRQVVDAEVAEILERADRLRLSRSREPGQDDERRRVGLAATGSRALRSSDASPVLQRRRPRPRLRRSSADAASPRAAPASRRSASSRAGVMAARPQQLIARRDFDQNRDVAARRHRHADQRHLAGRGSRGTRRRGRAARIRAPDPSVRAARPARCASTTASTRCRTAP